MHGLPHVRDGVRRFHNLSVGRRYRRVIDYEGGSCELAADGTAKTTAFATMCRLRAITALIPNACMCPTGAMHKTNWFGCALTRTNASGAAIAPSRVRIMPRPSIPAYKAQSAMELYDCVEQGKASHMRGEACPLRALDFGEVDDLLARHAGTTSDVKCRAFFGNTRTRIYI